MTEAIEFLKGYKLIGVMVLYILVTLLNGSATMADPGMIGDLTANDLKEALLAASAIAGKAFFNRTFGKKDGVEVEVK
jgi:hypothetical protein